MMYDVDKLSNTAKRLDSLITIA